MDLRNYTISIPTPPHSVRMYSGGVTGAARNAPVPVTVVYAAPAHAHLTRSQLERVKALRVLIRAGILGQDGELTDLYSK